MARSDSPQKISRHAHWNANPPRHLLTTLLKSRQTRRIATPPPPGPRQAPTDFRVSRLHPLKLTPQDASQDQAAVWTELSGELHGESQEKVGREVGANHIVSGTPRRLPLRGITVPYSNLNPVASRVGQRRLEPRPDRDPARRPGRTQASVPQWPGSRTRCRHRATTFDTFHRPERGKSFQAKSRGWMLARAKAQARIQNDRALPGGWSFSAPTRFDQQAPADRHGPKCRFQAFTHSLGRRIRIATTGAVPCLNSGRRARACSNCRFRSRPGRFASRPMRGPPPAPDPRNCSPSLHKPAPDTR